MPQASTLLGAVQSGAWHAASRRHVASVVTSAMRMFTRRSCVSALDVGLCPCPGEHCLPSFPGQPSGRRVLFTSPWPESIYAFAPMWATLVWHARLFAVDLPGFGASDRRADLLSPRTMGEFLGSADH